MSIDYSCVNETEYGSWVPQPYNVREFAEASETSWILSGCNFTLSILPYFWPIEMFRWLFSSFLLQFLRGINLDKIKARFVRTDNWHENKEVLLPKTSVSNWLNAMHSHESCKVLMRFWQQEMVTVMWLLPKPHCWLKILLRAIGKVSYCK